MQNFKSYRPSNCYSIVKICGSAQFSSLKLIIYSIKLLKKETFIPFLMFNRDSQNVFTLNQKGKMVVPWGLQLTRIDRKIVFPW